jgi:pyruvate dehydrogenase E1 component beta subunit
MLLEAIRDPDPVLYCEPDRLYRLGKMEVPDGDYTVPLGKAAVIREGDDITLVAWSAAVELCMRAADKLAEEGISATVVDLRTLVPFDVDTVVGAVAKTGRCVVVHEAPLSAGFGAEVVATLAKEAFYELDAPIERVCSYDVPYPAGPLEGWYLPSLERVVAAARRTASQ